METGSADRLATIAWIAMGIGLRLAAYLANRSFWCDEAMLARNILDRTWSELLQPLDFTQVAPAGFLYVMKLVAVVAGDSEFGLRLLPLLAGVASVPLFARLTGHFNQPLARHLSLALFALNGPAIFHSSEAKPYSTDLCIGLALTLWLSSAIETQPTRRRIAAIAAACAAASWLSFPSAFVIAAGLTLLTLERLHRRRGLAVIFAWALPAWLLNMLAHQLLLRPPIANDYLQSYWKTNFWDFSSPSAALAWPAEALRQAMAAPVGLLAPWAGVALFVAGAVLSFRHRAPLVRWSTLAVAAVAAGAAVRIYPFGGFGGRTILFLLPFLILPIGHAFEMLLQVRPHRLESRLLTAGALFLVIAGAASRIPAFITSPPDATEEIRPVLRQVNARALRGDTVYFYWKTHYTMAYYHRRYPFRHVRVIQGNILRDPVRDGPAFVEQLNRLRRVPRAWLVFSNWGRPHNPDEKMILDYLRSDGRVVEAFFAPGASAYRLEFAPSPAVPRPSGHSPGG
jgi:hypothetical protein